MSLGHAGLAPRRSAELVLLEELRVRGWGRLLIVECGDGWVAEEAWRRMVKGYVCGVDRSSKRVARAARLRGVPGKLEFQTWDGRHLPYPDAHFDSVMSRCDVRGWAEPVNVLRELRRVARAGGEVCLVEGPGAELPGGTSECQRLLRQAGLRVHGARSPDTGLDHDVGGSGAAPRILRARSSDGPA